jgi:mRNA interferase RelE/StbE
MPWIIDLSNEALKALSKIDRTPRSKIRAFIDKELPKMSNPRLKGKALSGDLKGLWRYRIGDYRVICQIKDNELVILIVELGHRKEVYRK